MGLNQMLVCRLFCAIFSEVTLKSLRMIPMSVLYHYRVQSGEGKSLFEGIGLNAAVVFSPLMNLLQIILFDPCKFLCDRFAGDSAIAAVTFEYYTCTFSKQPVKVSKQQTNHVSDTLWQWQRMATKKEKLHFPPQTQPQQPGKEYPMHQLPQHINPDYKPSNKLHVHHCSAVFLFTYPFPIVTADERPTIYSISWQGKVALSPRLGFRGC
ncbi:hypothetical protein NC651_039663 [Populus alba x Populus x berolinensis]|nr:hypothetical protein NC651_039663 [Populus alba x Populus x berolinensis]